MRIVEPRRFLRTPLITIGVLLSLLTFSAAPAAAAVGSGGGPGTFNYTRTLGSGGLPCAIFTGMTFDSNAGYTGMYSDGTRTYVGGVSIHMESVATFYGNPTGDFYADQTCTVPDTSPLVPVKGSAKNVGTAVVGTTVSCTYSSGSYTRVGANYAFTLTGTCSVNGGPATPTREVHTGTFAPKQGTAYFPATCNGAPPTQCGAADAYVAEPV
jgi:hypothetical protein